jgi:hypothetical protein
VRGTAGAWASRRDAGRRGERGARARGRQGVGDPRGGGGEPPGERARGRRGARRGTQGARAV